MTVIQEVIELISKEEYNRLHEEYLKTNSVPFFDEQALLFYVCK